MRLGDVIADLDAPDVTGDLGTQITDVAFDSRAVEVGTLFCCVRGEHADGHDFAASAVERGASALLVDRAVDVDVPLVRVPDTRRAMGLVAATFFGHPSQSLAVVGVTGTNGKTTTTHLLRSVLVEAGLRAEVLGTLSGARTTPEGPDLQRRLAGWRDSGVEAVAMEVSSHALALDRVAGTRFRVAVFTNLSRDHLDFHRSMEAYFDAKARLFEPAYADAAVVNLDSPHGRLLRDAAKIPTTGFSVDDLDDLTVGAAQSTFTWRGQRVRLGLGGGFNVSNALAAAETGRVLGIPVEVVAAGLSRPVHLPGRFETIDAGQPFTVVVDYAHTPDGLEQLLDAARDVAEGNEVAVLFGCGGDRDASKRPAMGEVAARLADRVVLTSDNSRGEDTGAIIDAVRQGFDRAPERRARELLIEPDRRVAIGAVFAASRPGDVVLLAGKGHETTQAIGHTVVPFDDRQVARDELARLAGRAS